MMTWMMSLTMMYFIDDDGRYLTMACNKRRTWAVHFLDNFFPTRHRYAMALSDIAVCAETRTEHTNHPFLPPRP